MAHKNESSPLAPPPFVGTKPAACPSRLRDGPSYAGVAGPSFPPSSPLFLRGGPTAPTVSPCLSSSGGDQPLRLTLPLVAVPYPPASRRSSRPRPRPREMRVQRCRGRRLRRGSHAPPRGCPGRRPTPPARCKGRLSGSPAQSTLMRLPGSPSHTTCRRNRQVSASLLHMALWRAACGME